MANERNIHWVRVQLRVNAPLPSLYPSWDRYIEDCAKVGEMDSFFETSRPLQLLIMKPPYLL
ncbi:hypothetical protein Scep_009276 [Stephania cephalantha]|uniref:Uncharacterized protein n=1 Tax=Stephania cephalantha TaxID=152367 RepID=A0AAP0JTU3_9MAGN